VQHREGIVIQTIAVTRAPIAKPKPATQPPDFGTAFTDHLFLADWEATHGWGNPRIESYGPIMLDPAAGALQYGQSVFEGIKAFRGVDGQVRLFRPEQHLARLSGSAARLCIPVLNPDRALEWLVELVRLEAAWVPPGIGNALYIRPTIIATEAYLGVRPARSYRYFVILSPVGPYAPDGFHPVKIRVEDTYVRAVSGGVGAAKTGGNYAGSLLAAEEAHRHGFDQVLWLDGVERRYLDEVGTMNIMLRIDDEIITPPVSDSILAGCATWLAAGDVGYRHRGGRRSRGHPRVSRRKLHHQRWSDRPGDAAPIRCVGGRAVRHRTRSTRLDADGVGGQSRRTTVILSGAKEP
jgi:branched-chain amino acid aminotransferase